MWNYDSIRADMENRIPDDPAAIRAALLELMVAAYPIYSVLSTMDCPGTRGTWFRSKLFPMKLSDEKGGDLHVYNHETKDFDHRSSSEEGWTALDYEVMESVRVGDREANILPDEFSILESYLEVAGGQGFNGIVHAKDVRHFCNWYRDYPKPDTAL